MSDEKNNETTDVSRRRALKVIAVGVGAAGSLPVLGGDALGQHHGHHAANGGGKNQKTAAKKAQAPKFFTPAEMATLSTMTELIIPTDDRSPGAQAAEVPAFIDLMVSESPTETKTLWRTGLAAVEKMSQAKFSKNFNACDADGQVALFTEISKNERTAKTLEERFFRALKNLTIDGYYTSEIGIHKELQYQGNAYLKEWKGCTHPEHQST